MKFGFPLAYAMTMLSWGGIEFEEGYRNANQLDNFKKDLMWGTDWIISAHTEKFKLCAQVLENNKIENLLFGYFLKS